MRKFKFRTWNKIENKMIYSDWKYGFLSFMDNWWNDYGRVYKITSRKPLGSS
jgi:hypothetical protein